jgi:hypothetical protein
MSADARDETSAVPCRSAPASGCPAGEEARDKDDQRHDQEQPQELAHEDPSPHGGREEEKEEDYQEHGHVYLR